MLMQTVRVFACYRLQLCLNEMNDIQIQSNHFSNLNTFQM